MLESAFLFVGCIAFAWTLLTIVGAVYIDREDDTGDVMATVSGVVGFVLWGVWTFGALNIEVVGDAVTYTFTHPELAVTGVAMSLVPGYIALTGPINLINRHRDPSTDEI